MLSFRKIDKSDIAEIRPYFGSGSSRVCTKAIGVMYMWSGYFGTEIARYEEGLIIKDTLFGEAIFMVPRGKNREKGLELIEGYLRETGGELRFNSVDDEDLAFLAKTTGTSNANAATAAMAMPDVAAVRIFVIFSPS